MTDTKVVPLEPTEEMLLSAGRALIDECDLENDPTHTLAYVAYKAMLSAAPSLSGKPDYDRFGYALAMRVLQSDLYANLDERERAECDALVNAVLKPLSGKPHSEHSTGGVDARQPQAPGAVEPAEAWLIERASGEKAVVLSPLTDDTYMDEGDAAWPLVRRQGESSGTHHRYGEQTRDEALEEAARECEANIQPVECRADRWAHDVPNAVRQECAESIRALKSSGGKDEKR